MARSMFPFDDSYRMTFNGTHLPSQNSSGEIMPFELDSRFEKIKLDDAPSIPHWRKKANSNLEICVANPDSETNNDKPTTDNSLDTLTEKPTNKTTNNNNDANHVILKTTETNEDR